MRPRRYTSGSTGNPKGVVHTTGGYMVQAHASTRYVFDLQPGDVYWCTADCGWVGRSHGRRPGRAPTRGAASAAKGRLTRIPLQPWRITP